MRRTNQEVILRKLLLQPGGKGRVGAALIALYAGTTLLLISVLIWWNFQELMYGKASNDSLGSTFLTISKTVTNDNMAKPGATLFGTADIEAARQAPQVQELGVVSSNHFPVYAVIGGGLAFATELPLESVPDHFLDQLPQDWKWQPGQADLPIIISNRFLDMYNNLFAPGQGLPQLSPSSVKSIGIQLKAGTEGNNETFLAHIVGFSDRIDGVMAPQSFIDYGNSKFGLAALSKGATQLILKVKDPSDARFTKWLQQQNYSTNGQNLRWSRVRGIVETVVSATGILSLMLMGISILVFILFIELSITRARESLTLLITLGYAPHFLSRFLTRNFLPPVFITLIVSLITALTAQLIGRTLLQPQGLELALLPGWEFAAVFAVCVGLLVGLVVRGIRKAIG